MWAASLVADPSTVTVTGSAAVASPGLTSALTSSRWVTGPPSRSATRRLAVRTAGGSRRDVRSATVRAGVPSAAGK